MSTLTPVRVDEQTQDDLEFDLTIGELEVDILDPKATSSGSSPVPATCTSIYCH